MSRTPAKRKHCNHFPKQLWSVGAAFLLAGLVGTASGQEQERLRRSIQGPVTQEAVTRSLVLMPVEDAGDSGGAAEVSLMLKIAFGFDSAELTGEARRDLDNVAGALQAPELVGARLTLEGHTDASGSAAYNLRLSQQRAEAVVAYLTSRGVEAHRLQAVGFGEDRPLSEFDGMDDRQRRVEIVRTF